MMNFSKFQYLVFPIPRNYEISCLFIYFIVKLHEVTTNTTNSVS